MTDTNVSEFFDDARIKEEVERVWASIFQATYSVLQTAGLFGFDEIEIKSNPNIHQLIQAVGTLGFWLDCFYVQVEDMDEPDHDLLRMIFNAKSQVDQMQSMALGLKTKDRQIYDTALHRLKTQLPI